MSARMCDCGCGRPMCSCGEDHQSTNGRCRDCDLDYLLDGMQCSVCQRMRYRTTPLGDLGAYLWGDKCDCPAGTPSMRDKS